MAVLGGTTGNASKSLFDLARVSGCPVSAEAVRFLIGYVTSAGVSAAGTLSWGILQSCLSVADPVTPKKYGDIHFYAGGSINNSERLLVTKLGREYITPTDYKGWSGCLDVAASTTVDFTLMRQQPGSSSVTAAVFRFNPSNVSASLTGGDLAATGLAHGTRYFLHAPTSVHGAQGFSMTLVHSVSISGFANPGNVSVADQTDIDNVKASISTLRVATSGRITSVSNYYSTSMVSISGSNVSISAIHENQVLYFTNAGSITVNFKGGFSKNGRTVTLLAATSGSISCAGVSGVTLNARGQLFNLNGKWSEAIIRQVNASTAVLSGDIA